MIELNMAKFNVKNPQTGEYEPLDGASQAKVQSDWNQTDNSTEDFIKNKPNLGIAASKNVDQVPTLSSTNLVESNGVAVALSGKADLENGKIPISQLPPTVIERMVTVADDTARFALTINEVQLGDTVKVVSTNKMYMVIDTGNLDKEAGYQVYVAGRAAEAVADQNGNTINTTYATVAALNDKVDKVLGKGLSTNDFDNTYKAKVDMTKTEWINTRNQYDQLVSDDYDLYFVVEDGGN